MITRCIAWHAHHHASSPLEILDGSFSERMEEIDTGKAAYESREQIERRKSLFKKFVGGVKSLPKDIQKLYTYIGWEEEYAGSSRVERVMRNNLDEIMKLHKKQCGCPWTTRNRSIFNFAPKVSQTIYDRRK